MSGVKRRARILIVDDDDRNLRLLESLLSGNGYDVGLARNGQEAIDAVPALEPDLIFLDIMMPVMDGYEACRRLKDDQRTQNIPIVMVTALEGRDSRLKGLQAGANDFLTKPVDSAELMLRTKNLLRIKEFEDFLAEHNRILEMQVAERTAQLTRAFLETVYRLTLASEYKDEATGAHIKRISIYAHLLASTLGLDREMTEYIFHASPMHDVGKLGIPDSILLKQARLVPAEYEVMKTHTVIGGKILQGSNSPIIVMGESIAMTHHECWDGAGYPRGLRGEEIPVEGMIVKIIDQYDALRSRRPYKPAFTHEKTLEIITKGDEWTQPGHFDPRVLQAFQDKHGEFEQIYREYSVWELGRMEEV